MPGSKICFKCDIEKPISEFYKHSKMADGHLNKCKQCAKNDSNSNRAKNYDYYIEYDRQRSNNPNRVEARQRYSQTEAGKAVLRKAKDKWMSNNTIKRAANIIVGNALQNGKITKPEKCSKCGNNHNKIHGHHDDYRYPMTVRWLCPKCHSKWHKENGEGIF